MTAKNKPPVPRGDDPLNCQTAPRLGYEQFHEDAEARGTRGERQWFCSLCARYRWKEYLCADGAQIAVESMQEAT